MSHKIFSALLIPDTGDAIRTKLFKNAVTCHAHARAEAKLLFRAKPAVEQIELVLCEDRSMIWADLIERNEGRQ